MMAFALIATSTLFTACNDDDDKNKSYTVSFEEQPLNNEGFWIGGPNGEGIYDGYASTKWNCEYIEGPLLLNTTYNEGYGLTWWNGYAISSRTQKDFIQLTPDQYNNVTGKAHSGKNFAVVQPWGETIDVLIEGGAVIESLWYTNSSYAYSSMKYGDEHAGKPFDKDDFFTCIITGVAMDDSERTIELELAADGHIVKDWKKANLRPLGKVKKLSFSFIGSRSNEYGMLTPTYICIDDVKVQLPEELK